MTGVAMLEAALIRLRAASADIDPQTAPQLGLSINVLANTIAAGHDGVNAAIANDIEFAMNDLSAAIDELPQSDADRLAPIVATLRRDVDALKAATALDPALIALIRDFQSRLRERMKAIERMTYVEAAPQSLPHPPASLRDDAIVLARQLAATGFATPALSTLIADPDSLRFHSIREILDEMEVISG
jgi:hypothetical protein